MEKIKKYSELIVYGAFILAFMILIIMATAGQSAPYRMDVFGTGIQWYALFILTGITFATILGFREFKKFKVDTNILWDGLLYCLPLAIIGTRLWYVIFNFESFIINGNIDFLLILGYDQRSGQFGLSGLAIHGGIMATLIFTYFFTKKRRLSYFWLLDVVAPGFLIGQTLGRWGNFMNQELYGPAVDNLNWLPRFISDQMKINGQYHHPTFLYESVWNLFGLILILVFRRTKFIKVGDIISFYLIWYGIGRIPTELLRMSGNPTDPLMFGPIPVSIFISCLLILGGASIIIGRRIFNKNIPLYMDFNKKCVLFDLDGTLLDTKDIILKSLDQTLEEMNNPVKLTDKEKLQFIGPTLKQAFSLIFNDEKKISEAIEIYKKYSRVNNQQEIKVFNNVKETLIELRKKEYLIGIVSSKKNELVRQNLIGNNLLKYFDIIIGADNVVEHKPDKEPIVRALNILGIDSANAVYVGDHPNDIIAAKSAKVLSVGVSYTQHYEAMLSQKPDVIIDSVDKLLEFL